MPLIKTVCGKTPKWGNDCYFSENATIVGDVTMGDQCTVWFNAVVRGDVNYIRIGNRVNIQDGSCLHTLYQKAALEIGDDVTIGHNVTLHGCTVHNCAMQTSAKAPSSLQEHSCCRTPRSVQANYGAEYPPSSSRRSIPSKPRNSTKASPPTTSCIKTGTNNIKKRCGIQSHRFCFD